MLNYPLDVRTWWISYKKTFLHILRLYIIPLYENTIVKSLQLQQKNIGQSIRVYVIACVAVHMEFCVDCLAISQFSRTKLVATIIIIIIIKYLF